MKKSSFLLTGSFLVATWMTTGFGLAQTPGPVHPDVSGPGGSKGGSQSERTGETGVPLPKGSAQSGTVEMGKSGNRSSDSSSAMNNRGSTGNAKEVQQALKDKGYDPGPVDGVMGTRTKEALKSFQSASNLQATGTLNPETAEKLGIRSSGSTTSRSSSSTSTNSRDNMKSSNTTVGKDTDQPNQSSSKNR